MFLSDPYPPTEEDGKRTYDFTPKKCTWGHNILSWRGNQEKEIVEALIICSPSPRAGDYLINEMKTNGLIRWMITGDVDTKMDPGDLHDVTLVFDRQEERKA